MYDIDIEELQNLLKRNKNDMEFRIALLEAAFEEWHPSIKDVLEEKAKTIIKDTL